MTMSRFNRSPFYLATIAALIFTGACSDTDVVNQDVDAANINPISEVGLTTPRALSESRAIDPNTLSLTLLVNGNDVPMQRQGDTRNWSGSADVPSGSAVSVEMTWRGANDLILATLSETLPAGSTGTIGFDERDYVTDHDQDADGFSNLLETNLATNPTDAGSQPQGIDVIVPRTDTPPLIDGLYAPPGGGVSVWESATWNDVEGNQLLIDNLVMDDVVQLPGGNTGFKFGMLHDGRFLYILAFGEDSQTATLHGDSSENFYDDLVGVVIDADGGLDFDGNQDNDLEWLIPLVKRITANHLGYSTDAINTAPPGNGRAAGDLHVFQLLNGTREVEFGNAGTQYIPEQEYIAALKNNISSELDSRVKLEHTLSVDLEFATCKCNSGQHAYEVKIDMAQAGVVLGQKFGLEMYMVDDVDGGISDASYHWKLTPNDFNFPTRDLGVAVLE